MIINGKDYHFAYSVGAYIDISALKLPAPKTVQENNNLYIYSSVAMSKAYEDIKKEENPEYETNYLTLAKVRNIQKKEVFDRLKAEVDEAYKKWANVTVKTQPKKASGKQKNSNSTVEEK